MCARAIAAQTLSGAISSIEDHGYIVDLGIPGLRGFLARAADSEHRYLVGELVDCEVIDVNSAARIAKLAAVPTDRRHGRLPTAVPATHPLRLSALTPGLRVTVTVKSVAVNGLWVTFAGGLQGSIDLFHLAEHATGEDVDFGALYAPEMALRACVLSVCHESKSVELSVRPQLLDGHIGWQPGVNVGDIIGKASVLRADPGLGVLFALAEPHLCGYAHISRLSDAKEHKLGSKFATGTVHRCRVVGMCMMEQLVSVSLQRSVLEQPFLRYEDCRPGMLLDCTILSVFDHGVLVAVTDHIRGWCPLQHLSDVRIRHPHKHFQRDQKIQCRVLLADPAHHRLLLTHKRTLLRTKLPLITSYDEVVPGTLTHGVITSLRGAGCIVHFYNNVSGLVPLSETKCVSALPAPPRWCGGGRVSTGCHANMRRSQTQCSPRDGSGVVLCPGPSGEMLCPFRQPGGPTSALELEGAECAGTAARPPRGSDHHWAVPDARARARAALGVSSMAR